MSAISGPFAGRGLGENLTNGQAETTDRRDMTERGRRLMTETKSAFRGRR